MAINFPDNPSNGDTYVAPNGIEYTYNAVNDSWTGALGAGSAYWDENASGNIYPKDVNAKVLVGGDGSGIDPITLDPGAVITIKSSGDGSDKCLKIQSTVGGTSTTASITSAGTATFTVFNIDALPVLPS